jgi:ATP-dependent DNA helicase RecG
MELDELKERILRWENLHTEFKEWPVHPDDLAAGIVAFANTDGGQLIHGIADNRQIIGVENPDAVERTVDNVAYNNCEPTITIVQEVISIEGKKVIVVHVPKGDERPYRTNRGIYYVRTSSGRRQASREELLRLFQASESLYFDETVVGKTTVDDIDKEYLERFLKEHYGGRSLDDFWVPAEQVMRNLRLVRNNHLTVAGVLLFGKNPQALLPYAQINAAKFPGTDIADAPEDRKDFGGKLIQQLEDVERFLKSHLHVRHRINGFQPERYPEIPEDALREGIVNALVHRDYSIRAPIRVLIFEDRLDIRSPGCPPNTVDVEAMKFGTHVPRNPIILSHFAKFGYVTSIGSGIPRIISRVQKIVGREPDLIIRANEFVLSIPRSINS